MREESLLLAYDSAINHMKTLNIIGAGRVGLTLGALFHRHHVLTIQDVLDGSLAGAREAVAFIGHGTAVGDMTGMRPAEVWMLTVPDRRIAECGDALAASGLLRLNNIVFHCSGALPSAVLDGATAAGARVASIHPIKTFAEPLAAADGFAGTWCGCEGDAQALAVLEAAFSQLGARPVRIDPERKTLYHAATVIVCNDLVALLEAGLRCYGEAGIAREDASRMMEPIVRETLNNVSALGAQAALTGPVARGDHEVVARQLAALGAWDGRIAEVYRALAVIALDLARARGGVDPAALAAVAQVLGDARTVVPDQGAASRRS